jgi:hypothetical protein
MELTKEEMNNVTQSINTKYKRFANIVVTEAQPLFMGGVKYQTCSAITDKVRVLFVIFDSKDQVKKELKVKSLINIHGYNIGHIVDCYLSKNKIGITISDEITD